jgi:SH3-like domain-containing protein
MKSIIQILIIALFLTVTVNAQKETACSITAYITDTDSSGFNVRNGAGTSFKVIGAIPFNSDGTTVDIIASNDKWMKISGAQNAENDKTFSKTGWVHAPFLAVRIAGNGPGTVKAFSTASKKGKVVANLAIETEYALESCSGSWLKISIANGGGMISGWIPKENQCANPWTTCS